MKRAYVVELEWDSTLGDLLHQLRDAGFHARTAEIRPRVAPGEDRFREALIGAFRQAEKPIDHACGRCVPGGDLVAEGFICWWHIGGPAPHPRSVNCIDPRPAHPLAARNLPDEKFATEAEAAGLPEQEKQLGEKEETHGARPTGYFAATSVRGNVTHGRKRDSRMARRLQVSDAARSAFSRTINHSNQGGVDADRRVIPARAGSVRDVAGVQQGRLAAD